MGEVHQEEYNSRREQEDDYIGADLSLMYRCRCYGDMMLTAGVRDEKIQVRVCLTVGTNMRIDNYIDSKPKWLGLLGRHPEVRSPTENRRVTTRY